MNTKNRGVVYMKPKAEEFVPNELQSYNPIEDNRNKKEKEKEKRPYIVKNIKNFSPGGSQKIFKNFNNDNTFYKKNTQTPNHNFSDMNHHHKGSNESEINYEKFRQNSNGNNGEKKNKFNHEYNKAEKYKNYKSDKVGYNMHPSYNYNNDNKAGVSGSKENNFNFSNNYNKDGGMGNTSSVRTNPTDGYVRKNFVAKVNNGINPNSPMFSNGNYANNFNKNFTYVNNNMPPNKVNGNATYFKGMNPYMAYNPYNQANYPPNANNLYHNNYNKLPNQVYSNITSNNNSNFNPNYKVNEKNYHISTSSTATHPSANLNSSQILEERIRTSLPYVAKTQAGKLKITEKLIVSNSNFLDDYKQKITAKLYNSYIDDVKNTNSITDRINPVFTPAKYNSNNETIVNNHESNIINKESGNIRNNHLNYLDKHNSMENLSHEESTGISANDNNSDRDRHSFNNKKVDLSVSQSLIPFDESHEYLKRNILISDSNENLNTISKERSYQCRRSPKMNSFTPRKNAHSIRDKNIGRQSYRRVFKNEKNSQLNEKNKFNKFSFDAQSPQSITNLYVNEGNDYENENQIKNKFYKFPRTANSDRHLTNLMYGSTENSAAGKKYILESKTMSKTFNLDNHNINSSAISLESDTSFDNENLELITVSIKIDSNTSKEISIKKHQNIFTTAKEFCRDHQLNPSLTSYISEAIHKAISSINAVLNCNLSGSNKNRLSTLHELYTNVFDCNANEHTEFDLKNGIQNSKFNNLSCITLLNSDDEDEFQSLEDKIDELNYLNITL